jgi:hypothetical protein
MKIPRNNFTKVMLKVPNMELIFSVEKGKQTTSHIKYMQGMNSVREELFGY